MRPPPYDVRAFEKSKPTIGHFVVGPAGAGVSIDLYDDVIVVAHHGVGIDIDGKSISQLFDAIDDPATAMTEVEAGIGIDAAQVGASNASADAVVVGGVLQ